MIRIYLPKSNIYIRLPTAQELSMAWLRWRAHNAFDKIWKDLYMSRNKAYKWLSEELGSEKGIHFATMSRSDMHRAIKLSKTKHKELIGRHK